MGTAALAAISPPSDEAWPPSCPHSALPLAVLVSSVRRCTPERPEPRGAWADWGALCWTLLCRTTEWVEDFPDAGTNRILEVLNETQTVGFHGPLEEEKFQAVTINF